MPDKETMHEYRRLLLLIAVFGLSLIALSIII